MPVQFAVPLSVGMTDAQIYIHPPKMGLIDGVKVCACPRSCDSLCMESCGYQCEWHSLPADVHIVAISNISPGSQYQLGVYSTSGDQMGPPCYTLPIKTSKSYVSDTFSSIYKPFFWKSWELLKRATNSLICNLFVWIYIKYLYTNEITLSSITSSIVFIKYVYILSINHHFGVSKGVSWFPMKKYFLL